MRGSRGGDGPRLAACCHTRGRGAAGVRRALLPTRSTRPPPAGSALADALDAVRAAARACECGRGLAGCRVRCVSDRLAADRAAARSAGGQRGSTASQGPGPPRPGC